jgi:hypothetical protein
VSGVGFQVSVNRWRQAEDFEVGSRNAEVGKGNWEGGKRGDRRQMTKRMLTTDRHGGTRNITEDFLKLLAIYSVKLREFPWLKYKNAKNS